MYATALSRLNNKGMMPLPSNGGSGIRLKVNNRRFKENSMLKSVATPAMVPS